MDDPILDEARSYLPTFVVAESPDGNVLSHRGGYPDDDTPVWLDGTGNPDAAVTLGDLYAQYGDDLVTYADPEERPVAAAMATKTADGEVTINPDAPPDPKLQLSAAQQDALAAIPERVKAAEAKGDTDEVAALERYADALRSGRTEDEAKAAGWPVAASLDSTDLASTLAESYAQAHIDVEGITASLLDDGMVLVTAPVLFDDEPLGIYERVYDPATATVADGSPAFVVIDDELALSEPLLADLADTTPVAASMSDLYHAGATSVNAARAEAGLPPLCDDEIACRIEAHERIATNGTVFFPQADATPTDPPLGSVDAVISDFHAAAAMFADPNVDQPYATSVRPVQVTVEQGKVADALVEGQITPAAAAEMLGQPDLTPAEVAAKLGIPQAVTAALCGPADILRPGANPAAVLDAEPLDGDELAAEARYQTALAAGASEAEAREQGWPGQTPDDAENAGITAALALAAIERIEETLTPFEDALGITASMNGTGVIPRPVQRMAVGENPDAQAQVVAAFEANYRDDVTEFVEDVLGPRPDPDTPEHDADAWDALAREARLWHAKRLAVTAALRQANPD